MKWIFPPLFLSHIGGFDPCPGSISFVQHACLCKWHPAREIYVVDLSILALTVLRR